MSHLKRIIKQSISISFYQASQLIVGFITVIIFTHTVSPKIYGEYTLVRNLINMLGVYSLFGLGRGLLRLGSQSLGRKDFSSYDKVKNYSASFSFIISIIIFLLIFAFAEEIATGVFDDQNLAIYFRLFSFVIPLRNLNLIVMTVFQILNKTSKGQFLFVFLYPIILLSSLLISKIFFVERSIALVSFIIANLLYGSIVIFFVMKLKIKFSLLLDQSNKKELFATSFPVFLSSAFHKSKGWLDSFLLGVLSSTASVGLYFVGFKIASIINMPATGLNQVFLPIAGRMLGANEYDELNKLYKVVTRTVFFIACLFFGVIFFSKGYIIALFGKDYNASVLVVIYVLIGELFSISVGSTSQLLTLCGGAKLNLINSIITPIIMVISCVLLIPEYGIIGAGISHSIAIIPVNILSVIELKYFYKLSPYDKKYLYLALIFLSIFGCFYMLDISSIIKIIGYAISFTFLIYFIILDENDKNELKKIFNYRKQIKINQ